MEDTQEEIQNRLNMFSTYITMTQSKARNAGSNDLDELHELLSTLDELRGALKAWPDLATKPCATLLLKRTYASLNVMRRRVKELGS